MKLSNRSILYLILLVAGVLRFVHYFQIPFMHDELSAIFRLEFNSFSELIEKGVKVDGHPAGIQVFLFYWTKIFGLKEWVVKLPFTIFGLLSVYLVYLIGRKWFNETVGLLASAFIATVQFAVMYSQIARPYVSGLFFSLLMVTYWSNLILTPGRHFNRNLIIYALAASLCTYNHHFSLLFAAIVGITGIILVKREHMLRYLAGCLAIVVLYLPHLKIFFYQLSVGGVGGWLTRPHNDFILEFIGYLFNYSFISLVITGLIVVFLVRKVSFRDIEIKFLIISIIWFLIPFLVGFFYSKYVNSVLQYSVLIFSFSYLYFILFGIAKEQPPIKNLLLVSLVLTVNILSLTLERKHYSIFYASKYEQILEDYQEARTHSDSIICIVDSKRNMNEYYLEKSGIDSGYIWYSDTFSNISDLKSYLEHNQNSYDYLYLGCLSFIDPLAVPVIKEFYPRVISQRNYFTGTTYLFSKGKADSCNILGRLDFDNDIPSSWNAIDKKRIVDTIKLDNNCYHVPKDSEYGPTYIVKLKDIEFNKNDFIDISVKAKSTGGFNGVQIVSSLENKRKMIYWGSTAFDLFNRDTLTDGWETFYHSVKLSDIHFSGSNQILRIYIWNSGGSDFFIDDFEIKLRKGNPIIYGLYEKI